MSFPRPSFAARLAVLMLCPWSPAFAHDGVHVIGPYIRSSGAMAASAAAFMVIENHKTVPERLVAARSDAAERVELHTHVEDANGVMQMREVTGGFVIPASGSHALDRGGDHLMFLGLTRPLAQGDVVTVTLTFELSGEVVVDIPVDNDRKPGAGGHSHGSSPVP